MPYQMKVNKTLGNFTLQAVLIIHFLTVPYFTVER